MLIYIYYDDSDLGNDGCITNDGGLVNNEATSDGFLFD